jgi:hypothetical protein
MDRIEENIDHDERRIAELIGTLRHIEAPGDFDTRVRARIASRRDEKPSISWRPVLAGVVAVAVLALVGYLGMRSFAPNALEPNLSQTTATEQPSSVQNQPSIIAPTPAPSVAPEAPQTIASDKRPTTNKLLSPMQQGGSIDEASKDAHRPFTKDYVPSQHRLNDNNGLGTAEIPVTMVLEAIGVHATWNDGWQVSSVDQKNVAGRSGVRPGDIIDAINGQPLSETTSFKGSFSGKSIRIRRDGAVLDLAFKP